MLSSTNSRCREWLPGFVLGVGTLLVTMSFGVLPSLAADTQPGALEGATLAREGRCAAAIPLLSGGPGPAVAEADRLALLGRCQLRLGRYVAAAEHLAAAQTHRPADGSLALDLGIAHYGAGDLAEARGALAEAGRLGTPRAELLLYSGLLALDDAEAARAAELLGRARAIGGDEVEPVASYYEGLAHSQRGLEDEARAALERVARDWPDTEWARAAESTLERLGASRLRRWGSVRLGAEYDDNAVLRGRGVVLPEEIPDQSDERLVWQAQLCGELWRTEAWLASAGLTYQGSAHDTLGEFDIHFPNLALWVDRPLDSRWTARLLASAGYAWVDGHPFLFTHHAEAALFHSGEGGARTRFHLSAYRDDFKFESGDVPDARPDGSCTPSLPSPCSPFGLDESSARNRDGAGWRAGAEHTLPLPALGLELTAGARWHRFSARGSEYSFAGPEVRAAARLRLPLEWDLEAAAAQLHRSFRHPTTFPEPGGFPTVTQPIQNGVEYTLRGTPRTENETRVEVTLGRSFERRIRLELRWAYQRNRSSAGVFDFDRHQIGAYVTVGFGE